MCETIWYPRCRKPGSIHGSGAKWFPANQPPPWVYKTTGPGSGGISGPDSYSKLYATVGLERVIGEAWGTVTSLIIRGVEVCLIVTHCRSFRCCHLFSKLICSDTVSHDTCLEVRSLQYSIGRGGAAGFAGRLICPYVMRNAQTSA